MSLSQRTAVPNRVFLAYQWHIYRPIFEQIRTELHRNYPVYFYAIGRPQGQPSQALLDKIETVLWTSTAAVFDASKGNPNVSLEYGMARFIPRVKPYNIYLLIDENTLPNQINPGTPIISDLAGATQNRWKLQDQRTLKEHLKAIVEDHPYTKRFRRYCHDRRLTRGQFRRPLKIIRMFDERESILRREVLDQLQSEWHGRRYSDIERLLGDMHKAGLITITRGREWASRISIA